MSVNSENRFRNNRSGYNRRYNHGNREYDRASSQQGNYGRGRMRHRRNRRGLRETREERHSRVLINNFRKFRNTEESNDNRPDYDCEEDAIGHSARERAYFSENNAGNNIPPLMDSTNHYALNDTSNSAEPRKAELSSGIHLEESTDPAVKDESGNRPKPDLTRCKREKIDENMTTEIQEVKKIKKTGSDSRTVREASLMSTARSVSKKSSSSSSSSSSDSDSDAAGNITDLKRAVIKRVLSTKSSDDTKNESAPAKTGQDESSSSSSDSSSESDTAVPIKHLKKEKLSEDEVVCLGNLERVEDLVQDDEQPSPSRETCLFCEKKGHTSFQCFMICKNCGGKYHGFKDCSKPANLSTVLHNFMEFCWAQFYQYNPNRRFTLNQDEQSTGMRNLQAEFSNEVMKDPREKHKAANSTRSTPDSSKVSRKRFKASDSDSSLGSENKKISRHKSYKRESITPAASTSYPSLPFNPQFSSVFPFAFGPQAMQFNPQGVTMNPLLPYAQVMGYNPLNLQN